MILQATHTHLYPGHRGKVSGLAHLADLQTERDCLIEFSDGSAASARITRSANGWRLRAGAYRTAAGTGIAQTLWNIRLQQDGGQVTFHILGKAPTG